MSLSRAYPLILLFGLIPIPIGATPLDDPDVGDTGFSGPTTGDLTAVYWNPAALGILRGAEILISSTLQKTEVTVARSPIDKGDGLGSQTFPKVRGIGKSQPIHWPPGPGGFFGMGVALERRFSIALAYYTPYSSHLTMKPAADGQVPTRYHLRHVAMDHTAATTALAIHISDTLHLGVAAGFLFPDVSLSFDEDLALRASDIDCGDGGVCGMEHVGAAARIHLGSKGPQPPSYFISGGILFSRGRFTLGASYASRPLGANGDITVALEHADIEWPAATVNPMGPVCPANTNCLHGQISYRLPDIATLGITWKFNSRWAATGIVRFIHSSDHQQLALRMIYPGGLAPSQERLTAIPLYRGFDNAWDLRGRVVYERPRLRLGGTLRYETAAVPKARVTAAAVDGIKLEPMFAAEMTFWRRFSFAASYAFTYMLPVSTGDSAFHPASALACAEAQGHLDHPACQERRQGLARPSAAGRYTMNRHTLTFMTRLGF